MTKLTNCSIIACPKQRRRPPGRKYVARPTDHPTAHQTLADQPTVPPGIPPSAHLNSPNQLSPTPAARYQPEFPSPGSLRSARNLPRLTATRSPECWLRAAGPSEREERRGRLLAAAAAAGRGGEWGEERARRLRRDSVGVAWEM